MSIDAEEKRPQPLDDYTIIKMVKNKLEQDADGTTGEADGGEHDSMPTAKSTRHPSEIPFPC